MVKITPKEKKKKRDHNKIWNIYKNVFFSDKIVAKKSKESKQNIDFIWNDRFPFIK
jgi:hypothetical protein